MKKLEKLLLVKEITTGSLLDYSYFKDHYKMIAIEFLNSKLLMLIQEQFNKFILQQIYIEMEI